MKMRPDTMIVCWTAFVLMACGVGCFGDLETAPTHPEEPAGCGEQRLYHADMHHTTNDALKAGFRLDRVIRAQEDVYVLLEKECNPQTRQ